MTARAAQQLALGLDLRACDKRWRDGRERWRAPGETFDPRSFAVDGIHSTRAAKPFILQHHYAGSFVAARCSVGLWGPGRGGRPALAGVAVFSVGVKHDEAAAKWAGQPGDAVVQLGRFVCDDSVAYNGETWLLARAFRLLRSALPDVRAIVSYADPMERTTAAGAIAKRAHWGTIYQAANATLVGQSKPETLLLAPDASTLNRRALHKLATEDQGWRYVAGLVTRAGCPRAAGESLGAWAARAAAWPGFRRVRHRGNLVYVFALDRAARATVRALHGAGLPYPSPNRPSRTAA